MTSIHEQLRIDCSYSGALEFLDRVAAKAERLLPSHAQLSFLGERVTKDVSLSYEPEREASCFERRIAVAWRPVGGGPYPSFSGTIAMRAQSDGMLILEIYGKYAPPLGPVGAPFDLLAGQRIARKTARFLLEQIVSKMTDGQEHVMSAPRPSH